MQARDQVMSAATSSPRSVLPAARAGPGNAVLRSVNIDIILISLEEKLQSHSRCENKPPAVLKSVTISDRHYRSDGDSIGSLQPGAARNSSKDSPRSDDSGVIVN